MIDFLKALAENNNREWFAENKKSYQKEYGAFKKLIKKVEENLNKTDHIEKSKVFRIYRDVRFSDDKTPYKSSFSAGYTRATNALRGGYYLQIQPGGSFVGGGFWAPESADMLRIRKEFELDRSQMDKICNDATFKKYFGKMSGDELKTAPKGFDKTHPNIDLIRKKQWVVGREFSDEEVLSENFIEEVNDTYLAIRPFFDYMSHILTTDLNGESTI
jgi:uncharacterized protein (TIGR02453 family)